MVKDINPGGTGFYPRSAPKYLTDVNGALFFSAIDDTHQARIVEERRHGRRHHPRQGHLPGTSRVGDPYSGYADVPNDGDPHGLTNVYGRLFFSADDGVHGRELWTLAESTTRVVTPAVTGFPASTTAGVSQLHRHGPELDATTEHRLHGYGPLHQQRPPGRAARQLHLHRRRRRRAHLHRHPEDGRQPVASPPPTPDRRHHRHAVGHHRQPGGGQPTLGRRLPLADHRRGGRELHRHRWTPTATGPPATAAPPTSRSSDATAALPGNYTFTAADAGVHTFTATLKKAGTQTLTATDTVSAAIIGTQTGIMVNPAAASRLVLGSPASVKANTQFNITVTVVDAYGNVVNGFRGTITFASSDPTANLPGSYTFTATDRGIHTFTKLVLRRRGRQTITATDTRNSSLTGIATLDVL